MILRNAIIILTDTPITVQPEDWPGFTGNRIISQAEVSTELAAALRGSARQNAQNDAGEGVTAE